MRVRLGVVSYLNTRPLVEELRTGAIDRDFELIYDVPSRCAERLHIGETDVALIPAVEIGRGRDPYRIVPNVGIISNGPVGSVFIALNKEPEEIQTLALDRGSRTSVVLAQIILARQFGCRPQVFFHPPDIDAMLKRADAALLIGDPALALPHKRYRILDLGEIWTQMTGLPFVYACWTGRPDALTPYHIDKLIEAKEKGKPLIPNIAKDYAAETRTLSPAFYAKYLTRNILYDLGDTELEGLRQFYAYGVELGLMDALPDIRFYI
ncbi:MAG: menaquinone biosynthesis protein [Gemmatimonadota bacterium]|nr:menaquinone biosynthesis protein [Gemmatimonadota bacterium]